MQEVYGKPNDELVIITGKTLPEIEQLKIKIIDLLMLIDKNKHDEITFGDVLKQIYSQSSELLSSVDSYTAHLLSLKQLITVEDLANTDIQSIELTDHTSLSLREIRTLKRKAEIVTKTIFSDYIHEKLDGVLLSDIVTSSTFSDENLVELLERDLFYVQNMKKQILNILMQLDDEVSQELEFGL